MDIGKAFSFVFEDEKWISKVLLGGLFLIIPIVNFAVIGYMLKVAQNVAQGNPRPLPEWSEFGDHFMRGLHGIIIQIVYQLPTIIVYGVFFCVILAAGGHTRIWRRSSSRRDENTGDAMRLAALAGCRLPAARHGARAVPPDRDDLARRGRRHARHRGGARRGRDPAQCERRALHGAL